MDLTIADEVGPACVPVLLGSGVTPEAVDTGTDKANNGPVTLNVVKIVVVGSARLLTIVQVPFEPDAGSPHCTPMASDAAGICWVTVRDMWDSS